MESSKPRCCNKWNIERSKDVNWKVTFCPAKLTEWSAYFLSERVETILNRTELNTRLCGDPAFQAIKRKNKGPQIVAYKNNQIIML